MLISKYNVLINKEQASCGLLVDYSDYDFSFFDNQDLNYEVDYKKSCIYVFSENHKISFQKTDKELMYYALKTESLIIFTGDRKGNKNLKKAYEATLI